MTENAEQITRLITEVQKSWLVIVVRLCVQEIPPDRHCLQMAGKCGPLPWKTDEKQDLVKRGVSAQAKPFQNKETVHAGCQLTSAKKRGQSRTGDYYTHYTMKRCWVEIRPKQGKSLPAVTVW